ncbi:MAG: murein L,D-transpeptidase catalytic domain family protein [Sediminibacterium sp.]
MRRLRDTHCGAGLLAITILFACMGFDLDKPAERPLPVMAAITKADSPALTARSLLYDQLALNALGLSREAFNYAIRGFDLLLTAGKIQKDNIISIVDFSLPSNRKRLFVIDMQSGELLFNTYVSHGRNSGKAVATRFSNRTNSYESSLGFYVTGDTYEGKHGYSLRLEGEEAGINDNALDRGIVMHSAAYADESIAVKQGYIGRSQGCPAIPEEVHKPIIQTIKNGSCLFMYSPDAAYLAHSKLI